MNILNATQIKHVSGAAAAAPTTPVEGDLGFFPRTGIAWLDKIHVWEYANIWGPLLAKYKKTA